MADHEIEQSEELEQDSPLEVIAQQLDVVQTFVDIEGDPYDTWQEDKIRVITSSVKVILAANKVLLSSLK